MASTILIKRGLKTNLPVLERGELAYATDTKELFIGVLTEPTVVGDNVLISDITKSDFDSLVTTGLVWDSVNEELSVDFADGTEALEVNNIVKVMSPQRTDEAITARIDATLATSDVASESYVDGKINALPGTGLTLTSGALNIDNPFDPSGTFANLRAQATTAADVDLGNVTNESKTTMFTDPTFTGTVTGVTATHVGLGNVTNESKSTMFTDPTFTGTVSGVTATMVGLGNVTNESKSTMFTDPTFTGTVSGVTSTMVGLGNVTNESKATMFTNPTFTGTVSGVTATMVDLGNVTNESKATMFTNPTFTETVTIGGSNPKLTGLPLPVDSTDAASKVYVDNLTSGLRARTAAWVLVDFNLSGTYNSVPELHELTASVNGAFPTVDGILSSVLNVEGARFLLTGQTNKEENGLYVLKTPGVDSTSPWVIRRCRECATSEAVPGSFIFISKGDVYQSTGWVLEVDNPLTFVIGTDDITAIQFSGAGVFTAGTGLTLTASEFSLADNYGDTKNPYASKTSKHFLAAPNATNGAPTFREIVASDIPTLNQSTTGNAATATALATARTIGGISFDGTANINLPGVNEAGNQNTTGTAANVTGTVVVANGGTGATTHTNGNVLIGAGTGAITSLSRSGIDTRSTFPPATHEHAASDITSGELALARGGTNRSDGRSTGVIETNASTSIQFWVGTETQYNAIGTKNANTLYFIEE